MPIHMLIRKWRVVNTAPWTIFATLYFLLNLQMGLKKQECYITLVCNGLHVMWQTLWLIVPIHKLIRNEGLWIWPLGTFSQPYIIFLTYKWAQEARVLHYTSLEWLVCDKHSYLPCPFKGCEYGHWNHIQHSLNLLMGSRSKSVTLH